MFLCYPHVWFDFIFLELHFSTNTRCVLGVVCTEEILIWRIVTCMLYWAGVLNPADVFLHLQYLYKGCNRIC